MTDGRISSDAAWAGSMNVPSAPIATVGKPMAVTPFTMPAIRKVRAMTATRAAAGEAIDASRENDLPHSPQIRDGHNAEDTYRNSCLVPVQNFFDTTLTYT